MKKNATGRGRIVVRLVMMYLMLMAIVVMGKQGASQFVYGGF